MLDERVRAVLARLEQEDAAERAAGLPAKDRSRQVEPTTGRFLFALAACQAGIEVLEVGGSRGYSSIWLAAGARVLGGRLTSLERDPAKCAAWRANVAEAGLDEWAELIEGDAHAALAASQDTFDLVFLDAEKDDYEALFAPRAAACSSRAGSSSPTTCSRTSRPSVRTRRRGRRIRTLSSVTVPLDRGLELSVVSVASPDRSNGDVRGAAGADRRDDIRAPSIRSQCVCWHYRGKEVVRLE